jgi:hypothetical protein
MPRKKKIVNTVEKTANPAPEIKPEVFTETKLETKPILEDKIAAERRKIEKTLNLSGGVYNTIDESKYKTFLDSLGITDLQDEATKRGLKPIAERPFMTETLLKLFREYARQFIPMPEGQTGVAKGKEHKLQEMLRICRQGR